LKKKYAVIRPGPATSLQSVNSLIHEFHNDRNYLWKLYLLVFLVWAT